VNGLLSALISMKMKRPMQLKELRDNSSTSEIPTLINARSVLHNPRFKYEEEECQRRRAPRKELRKL
jgi:hypothetical protein